MLTAGIGGNFLFANGINDAGEVVGAASFQNHPFDAAIWRSGVVTDLGALPGDCFSQAFVMNSRRQIACNSATCDGNTIRAALWEDGRVFDLNTLISGSSDLLLVEANSINDRGEIAGNGFPAGCTDFSCTHAYVLVPCDHSNDEDCDDTRQNRAETMASEVVPPQRSASADRSSLPSTDIVKRMRHRSSQDRFLGGWPRK